MNDISPDFRPNKKDAALGKALLQYEATPEAIKFFDRNAYKFTDYGYWFFLSTLWVSYTGWSDLETWKRLFSSDRPRRQTSIMKPSELARLNTLQDPLIVYRAHRPDETDWIAYTLVPEKAAEFAVKRGVQEIKRYTVAKGDVLALFLRRGEFEVIVLDKTKPIFQDVLKVVVE